MIDDDGLDFDPADDGAMPAAEPASAMELPTAAPAPMVEQPAWPTPNERHIARLKQDQSTADLFEMKFGPGSASRALGIGTSETAKALAPRLDEQTRQHTVTQAVEGIRSWFTGPLLGQAGMLGTPAERQEAAESELDTARTMAPFGRSMADTSSAAAEAFRQSGPQSLTDPRMLTLPGHLLARGASAVAEGLTGAYATDQEKRLGRAERSVRGEVSQPQATMLRSSVDTLARSLVDFAAAKPVEFAGIIGGSVGRAAGFDIDPAKNMVTEFGKSIENKAKELFPEDVARQKQFVNQVSQGIGSTAAFYGTGMLMRLMGMGERGVLAGIAISGAAGNVPDEFDKATKALENGTTTEWNRFLNMMADIGLGATEALPFVGGVAGSGVRAAGRRVIGQMAEEGGQEFIQQLGTNTAANQLIDPSRDPYEGVLEGTAVAGITGGMFGLAMRGQPEAEPDKQPKGVQEARARGGSSTATDASPTAETPPAPAPDSGQYTDAQKLLISELDAAISGGLPSDADVAKRIRDLVPPPGSDLRAWRAADMMSDQSKLGPIRHAMGAAVADAARARADARTVAPNVDGPAEPMRPGEGAVQERREPVQSDALDRVRALIGEKPAAAQPSDVSDPGTPATEAAQVTVPEPTEDEVETELPAAAAEIEQFYAESDWPFDLDDTDVRAVTRNLLKGMPVDEALETYFDQRHAALARQRDGKPREEPAQAKAPADDTGPVAEPGGGLPEVGRDGIGPVGEGAIAGDGRDRGEPRGQDAAEDVAEDAAPAAELTDDDRRSFARVLAGKTPRSQWGSTIGQDKLQGLIDEAVADGRLAMRNGVPRRTAKAKTIPEALQAAPAPVARETQPEVMQQPTMDRAMEVRLQSVKSDAARQYVADLVAAEISQEAMTAALDRLATDTTIRKAVLDEIAAAYGGVTAKPKSRQASLDAIRGAAEGRMAQRRGQQTMASMARQPEDQEPEPDAEPEVMPPPADYGSWVRFRHIRNVLARNLGQRAHNTTFEPRAFEQALSDLLYETRITRADMKAVAEAYTGRSMNWMSRGAMLDAMRAEANTRRKDVALAAMVGADPQMMGSNLSPTEIVRRDIERLRQRLPEGVGVMLAPVLRVALGGRQMDAALGGRDLDMSRDARKARAEAMGFDTSRVWYHGTRSRKIDAFEVGRPSKRYVSFIERDVVSQGVFLSPSEDDAKSYGPNVGAYYARTIKTLAPPTDIPVSSRDPASMERSRKAWDDFLYIMEPEVRESGGKQYIDVDGGISTVPFDNVESWANVIDWNWLDNPEVIRRMKERGYDSAEVYEPNDESGKSLFVTNPSNLRSTNAAFDPAQEASANLMAAMAGRTATLEGGVFDRQAAGRYLGIDIGAAKRLLAISLQYGPDMALQTFTHEEMHILRALDLFTPEQWSTLSSLARKKPRKQEAQRILDGMLDAGKVSMAMHAKMSKRAGQMTMREIYDIDERYREFLTGLVPKNMRDLDRDKTVLPDDVLNRLFTSPEVREVYRKRGAAEAWIEDKLLEEVVAHAAADWADGRSYGTKIDRVMMSIRDFIESIGNWLRGNGYTHVGEVFDSVWSGEVARQQSQTEKREAERRQAVQQWMADNDVSAMAVRSGDGMMAALSDAPSMDAKIENIEAAAKALESLPSNGRRPLMTGYDVITYPGVGRAVYYVVASGKKLEDRRGNINSLGRFDVKPTQRLDTTGVEVTNAYVADAHRRKGIASAIYEIVNNDMAEFGGVSPSPRNQLSPDAQAFWGKRLGHTMFAIRDIDTGRSMRRDLDALGYYSQALEAARSLKQARGTPEQMLAQLKSAGVKDAEIEATGLRGFLDGKKSITRDEIVAHLEANRVGLNEVERYRSKAEMSAVSIEEYARENGYSSPQEMADDYDMSMSMLRMSLDGRNEDAMQRNPDTDTTKWSSYSLDPSNPTYRETVLHLPGWKSKEQFARDYYREARLPEGSLTSQQLDEVYSDYISTQKYEKEAAYFRSGHFPEPNIIGHMMTSMVKHEGDPVYLIDQIQSDWGQKLRDGGVRDEAKIAELKRLLETAQDQLDAAMSDAPKGDPFEQVPFGYDRPVPREARAIYDRVQLLGAELETAKQSPTGNPLVNTTDQWTTTTLRRAIRQAAEAGADYIAIPSGDTVLSYNPGDRDGMIGFYGSKSYSNDAIAQARSYYDSLRKGGAAAKADELEAKLNEELARAKEGIVPKNLRKLLEKLDKDSAKPIKVDQVETPTKGMAGSGFTLFPLTPKIKAEVTERGQAMFAFAGERAKTADMDALARAKELEADGSTRDQIWTDTGWFRGVDGKWRFEIDDSGAKWSGPAYAEMGDRMQVQTTAGSLLDHPLLRAAYPSTSDTPTQYFRYDNKPMPFGSFNPETGGLRVRAVDESLQSPRSTILHEGQHELQSAEGFSPGGNEKSGIAAYNEISARINRLIDEAGGTLRNASPEIRQQVAALEAEQKALPFDPREYYHRLAGEVEARAVQKRMDMTADERRARPPWLDYDVPEDQQIVRFADGTGVSQRSYSAEQDGGDGETPLLMASLRGEPLDMSPEARKARAEAMGFDTSRVYYHGTLEPFDAFRVDDTDINEISGTYLATSRLEANMYAGSAFAEPGVGQDGGRVLPLYSRASNPAKLDVRTNKPIDPVQAESLDAIADEIAEGGNVATEALRNAGFDSVEYHQNGQHIWTVVFDPTNIRSVNAAFDTQESASPLLMAALSGRGSEEPSLNRSITDLKDALGIAESGGTSRNLLMRALRRFWNDTPDAVTTQGLRGLTVRQDTTNEDGTRSRRQVRLRPRANVQGQFDRTTGVISVRSMRDIKTIAHEGGHSLEMLLGTPLDELKAAHWQELVPAEDMPPEPLNADGYSGVDLDTYEQDLLIKTAEAGIALQDAAETGGVSPTRRLTAQAIGTLIGGALGAGIGVAAGNQLGGPLAGAAAGTVGAIAGIAIGSTGAAASVRGNQAMRDAAVTAGEVYAELVRAVGRRRADQMLDDVLAVRRDNVGQYVRDRYSATGTPRPRTMPLPDGPALSEAFARWMERYVMDAKGAREMAPNFYQAFEDLLDAEMPSVAEAMHNVQTGYQQYATQSSTEQMVSDLVSRAQDNAWERMAADGSFDNLSGKLSTAYNGLYDDLNPIAKMVQRLLAVADRNGVRDDEGRPISLKVAENPYKLMRLFRNSFNRGRMWLERGIADLGTYDVVGPSLRSALEVAFGGVARDQWNKGIYQEFGTYLVSKRAVAEYKLLAVKTRQLEVYDEVLEKARNNRSFLASDAQQAKQLLDRREDALIRAQTRLTDGKRARRTAETAVRNIEQRLRAKADQVLAAQMARDRDLEVRRKRELQALEREARAAVAEFEATRESVDALEIEISMLDAEIEQRKAQVDETQSNLDALDAAVEQLRTERQRTAKRGANRPPTLETREQHEKAMADLEAKYDGQEGRGDFREASRLVSEWTHRLLTVRYQAGFISEELYRELSARKDWYVPFQRDMTDASAGDVFFRGGAKKWSPFKKFNGSDRALINPLEVLSQDAYNTAQQIAFNEAVQSLVGLAERAGPGGGVIAERVPRTETVAANESTFDRIRETAIGLGIDPLDAHQIVQRMEQNFSDSDITLVWAPDNKSPVGPPQLPLWVNGERQHIRLNDPVFGREVFNALNGLGEELSSLVWEMAAKPARWLRIGITTHPNFILRNLLRDIPAAYIRAGVTPFKGHLEGLRMLRNDDTEVRGTDLSRGEFIDLYNQVGGIVGGQNVASIATVNTRTDVLDLRTSGPMTTGNQTWMGYISSKVEAIESAGRLGIAAHAYRRAVAHNSDLTAFEAMQEAAFVARDVYDWGRRGSKMLAVNRVITFLNAALQGTESAARGLSGESDRGVMMKGKQAGLLTGSIAVGVGAGSLVAGPVGGALGAMAASKVAEHLSLVLRRESDGPLSANEERQLAEAYKTWFRMSSVTLFFVLLYAMMKDDPWYEDIKDGTKSTHSWVKLSTLGSVVNHRINQGADMLGIRPQKDAIGEQLSKALGEIAMPEWMPNWLRQYVGIPDEYRIPKPFEWAIPGNVAEIIWDRLEGRDPRAAERIRASAYEVLAPPGVPQAAELLVGLTSGYDIGRSRPIVGGHLSKLAPHQQFDAYASELAIDVSKGIYDVLGKFGVGPDRGISPKMVDWVLSNQGAYWGKDIANLYGGVKRAGGLSNRENSTPYDLWLVAGVTGRGYRNSKSIEEFWKLHGQEGGRFQTSYQTYRTILDQSGDPAGATEFLTRLPPEERAYALLKQHFRGNDEKGHPLERVAAAHKINQDLRKDMILGRLTEQSRRGKRDFEARVALSPAKQTEVHDILERLSQIEVRNAMITLEREGWKGRPYLDPDPVIQELKASSPEVYELFDAKRSAARLREWSDVRDSWPKNRDELLKNGAEAALE